MEKELQLQPRLQCIASLVPQGARLADVGTDHGYLPVWLLQHGRIESAIASDINALPLDHALATAREYGVTERMDFRLCPGLAKIDLLRCWLCGHGYRFLSETLVRDKEQLYVVFRVRAGMGQELSEADALTGLLLRSDPLYGEYLSQHLIKLNRARDGLAVSSLADKEARIAHLENLIEEIERRKGEWEHGNGT